jgi:hypothetical protein
MTALADIAPPFIAMAHRIVWASVATVDRAGRPRSRVLHPYWEEVDGRLVGWIATEPTALKRAHLGAHPFASVNYWDATHDTCTAECHAELLHDDETRTRVWDLFANGPEPVGYDPSIIPFWTSPTVDRFAALRLDPYRLRVMPGTVMLKGEGEVLTWCEEDC